MRLKRKLTGDKYTLTLEVPDKMVDTYKRNALVALKVGDYWNVEPAKKKRSTGPHSQNHHANGHLMQIASETGNSFEVVKMESKKMACEAGYWRYETLGNGSIWPGSEANSTIDEAAAWIECIHRLAADLGIVLRED